MVNVEELDKAIDSHGTWKSRLQLVIATGRTDTPVEILRQDNQCAFGKWLYGPAFASMDKASIHYQMVKNLHAEFHCMAALVATMALDGENREAEGMLQHHYDEFAELSTRLTRAMVEWKKVLMQE